MPNCCHLQGKLGVDELVHHGGLVTTSGGGEQIIREPEGVVWGPSPCNGPCLHLLYEMYV